MLPLQAHGYRSGLSASPGFLQIRHTSSSSSSSSYLAAAATDDDDVDTFASSFSESEEDGVVLTDAESFGTSRSEDCGGAGAISIGSGRVGSGWLLWTRFGFLGFAFFSF